MNAVGTNTAQSTSAVATIGPVTSFIACTVAASGLNPSVMFRSTFSTTTIASSTTMPIASTSPNSDSVLSPKPNRCMTPSVPINDTGTASSGMIEARHVCRNTMTTMTTSASASTSVCSTAEIEPRTNTVGS